MNKQFNDEVYEISFVENNEEKFSLIKSDEPIKGESLKGDIRESLISIATPLINTLPNTAKVIGSMTSYKAVFTKEMKELMKEGSAVLATDKKGEILPYIVHKGKDAKNGQIINNIRLKPGVNAANISLLVWQVATIATAQKYLKDINENLDNLKCKIDLIHETLLSELYSKMKAQINLTQNIIQSIQTHNSVDDLKNNDRFGITNLYIEIQTSYFQFFEELNRKVLEFDKKQFKDKNEKKLIDEFQKQIDETISYFDTAYTLLKSLDCLSSICELIYDDSVFSNLWKNEIDKERDKLKRKIDKFEENVELKITELKKKNTLQDAVISKPSRGLAKVSSNASKYIARGANRVYLSTINKTIESITLTLEDKMEKASTKYEQISEDPFEKVKIELRKDIDEKLGELRKRSSSSVKYVDIVEDKLYGTRRIAIQVDSNNQIQDVILES